jgi:hypothetical protein
MSTEQRQKMPAFIFSFRFFSVKTTRLQDAKKCLLLYQNIFILLAGCVALPGSLPRGTAQGGECSGVREPGRLATSQGTSLASRHAHICL